MSKVQIELSNECHATLCHLSKGGGELNTDSSDNLIKLAK